MAFEICFKYHERLEEGGYDTTEEKTMTKRYGKGYEEISHEQIAASIIAQLSRRDIWITDVKVFEYVKKELRFKETKGGGIVLGNKKYQLDGSQHLIAVEDQEQQVPQALVLQQQNAAMQWAQQHPHPQMPQTSIANLPNQVPQIVPENRPPQRYVIFQPPKELQDRARIYKLTVGRKYGIYEEKAADVSNMRSGMLYYLRDDLGRGVWVRSFYFEDAVTNLLYDNELHVDQFTQAQMRRQDTGGFIDSVASSYVDDAAAAVSFDVPDIRR